MRFSRSRIAATVIVFAALLLVVFVIAARFPGFLPGWVPFADGEPYTVHAVTSGDTIQVTDGSGGVFEVQLLGVDAPDMSFGEDEAECGADESTNFLSEQIAPGTRIYLVQDGKAGDTDESGRLLRYVETGLGTDVNKKVLSEGYATNTNLRAGPAFERGDDYRQTAVIALDHGKGLWQSCNM